MIAVGRAFFYECLLIVVLPRLKLLQASLDATALIDQMLSFVLSHLVDALEFVPSVLFRIKHDAVRTVDILTVKAKVPVLHGRVASALVAAGMQDPLDALLKQHVPTKILYQLVLTVQALGFLLESEDLGLAGRTQDAGEAATAH